MFISYFQINNLGIYATWTIATGALAIAISLIFGSEKSHHILFPRGPFSKLVDRLWHALAISGAVLTLIGSLMLGIKYNSQAIVLIPISVGAYIVFHIAASFKLRQLYKNIDSTTKHQSLIWCLLNPYKKVDEHEPRIAIKS